MPINNPTALVEEFKKSGEFDRLRREVLARFQQDESYSTFKESVENLARKRLTDDMMLSEPEFILKELTEEIQRYPVVQRAVEGVRTFSDPEFLATMKKSLERILQDDKNGKPITSTSAKNETETARTEILQSPSSVPEKPTLKVLLDNDAQAPSMTIPPSGSLDVSMPPTTIVTSQPLLDHAPAGVATAEKAALGEEERNEISTPPAAKESLSGPPSSSAISAQNVRVNSSIDDDQTATTDAVMEDVHQAA